MKRLATCLIALTAATALDAAGFVNSAAAFPAYYLRFRTTKLPYSSCPTDAKNTVNKVGLANKVIDTFGASGTTPGVRGYIPVHPDFQSRAVRNGWRHGRVQFGQRKRCRRQKFSR